MKNAMTRTMTTTITALTCAIAMSMISVNANAEEWPFIQGDYWDVTGIDIKDGAPGITQTGSRRNGLRKPSSQSPKAGSRTT